MVVSYQRLDPLAVLLALPGAGAGILLMLFVTGTAISVPSHGIHHGGRRCLRKLHLLVTFARELRQSDMSAFRPQSRPARRGCALC
jgi:hypothetical protein